MQMVAVVAVCVWAEDDAKKPAGRFRRSAEELAFWPLVGPISLHANARAVGEFNPDNIDGAAFGVLREARAVIADPSAIIRADVIDAFDFLLKEFFGEGLKNFELKPRNSVGKITGDDRRAT